MSAQALDYNWKNYQKTSHSVSFWFRKACKSLLACLSNSAEKGVRYISYKEIM